MFVNIFFHNKVNFLKYDLILKNISLIFFRNVLC